MRKNPIQREIKRRGRCWHVYRQRQRVLMSTWERVNGMPLRGVGGTQVSASTLPEGQWRSDAYETRQRRIHLAVRHRGHCYRAGSLSLSTHALHHRVIKRWRTRWEIQGVPSLGARLCSSGGCVDAVVHKGLEKRKTKADMSLLTVIHS